MILTGSEIERERVNGRITIDPFVAEQVNPNSYNFRLGGSLRIYTKMPLDVENFNPYEDVEIPPEGFVLEPGQLYLAHTVEVLGSRHYAPTFAARSSVARLGLFINLSASLGDIGFEGQWTLQLYTMNRVRVYDGMKIGQMMWWRPQGRIELYDGKYQGSVGPRSSDIHQDSEKATARIRFPGLDQAPDLDLVGGKFASLAAASKSLSVPDAFAVTAPEFGAAVGPAETAQLTDLFDELRATVGAFFAESTSRIAEVAEGISLDPEARRLLTVRMRDRFGDGRPDRRFAVRSSGLEEDGATDSLAGVHQSVLEVEAADVADAVEACWRSYYAPPAIALRVRGGDFDPQPRLAVVVQELVRPELAGVAFTGLDGTTDDVTVEYVAGLAEGLVAGTVTPWTAGSADLDAVPSTQVGVITEVVRIARELRATRGHDVDVEWAADVNGVHVVQVRPVTARRAAGDGTGPAGLWIARVYFDEMPPGARLHEVAAVHAGYRAKRGPAHQLAAQNGISLGGGWVIGFTGRLLADPEKAEVVRAGLAAGRSAECVLDFGETLRQIVVPKDEVISRLLEVTGSGPHSDQEHAVIVRDFVRGDLGVISRQAGDALVVEYTPDGLMALNRGTTGAEAVVVEADGRVVAPPSASAVLPHLASITRFTALMQARYGNVTLEWVLDGGTLLFVDYSVLGGDDLLTSATGVRISAGTASGPLLTLDDDELLTRLSIGPAVSINKSKDVTAYGELARLMEKVRSMDQPPVIRVTRPYAVLSVLIGMVAGFVFDQGSTLCHLAILLREAGVPAVASTTLGAELDGAQVFISDGAISIASNPRSDDV